MGNAQAVTEFRQRRKESLIKVLGSECNLCGYHRCIGALEFHHIVPENKSYGLSNGNCHKIEDDLAEAKKCLLVCSNCHREIHCSDIWQNIDLFQYQNYNTEIANSLIVKKEEFYCSECGIEITRYSQSGMCASCVQKHTRKVNRPTREELKDLIRNNSFLKLSEKFGVSDNAIRKWCKLENLPVRKNDINSYSDEEWLNI